LEESRKESKVEQEAKDWKAASYETGRRRQREATANGCGDRNASPQITDPRLAAADNCAVGGYNRVQNEIEESHRTYRNHDERACTSGREIRRFGRVRDLSRTREQALAWLAS
jgi:hypothetical protein